MTIQKSFISLAESQEDEDNLVLTQDAKFLGTTPVFSATALNVACSSASAVAIASFTANCSTTFSRRFREPCKLNAKFLSRDFGYEIETR